ncbi:MAG: hypothetical protein U0869_03330 [Chloroflexota bacterium]
MKRTRLIAAVVPVLLLTIGSAAMAAGPSHGTGRWNVKAGHKGGIVRARGAVKEVQGPWRGATRTASTNPNMTNHGGPVMTSVTTAAIFWGPKWGDGTTAFAGDKIAGLNAFYGGWDNSGYAGTVTEYTSAGSSATATNRSTHVGSAIDTSTASGGQRTSAILNEVAKMVNAGRITIPVDGTAYVAVYTDLPRGGAQYCAWHSTGTFSKPGSSTPVRVQFAFFWALDGTRAAISRHQRAALPGPRGARQRERPRAGRGGRGPAAQRTVRQLRRRERRQVRGPSTSTLVRFPGGCSGRCGASGATAYTAGAATPTAAARKAASTGTDGASMHRP